MTLIPHNLWMRFSKVSGLVATCLVPLTIHCLGKLLFKDPLMDGVATKYEQKSLMGQ
jgi:hypothetical protein